MVCENKLWHYKLKLYCIYTHTYLKLHICIYTLCMMVHHRNLNSSAKFYCHCITADVYLQAFYSNKNTHSNVLIQCWTVLFAASDKCFLMPCFPEGLGNQGNRRVYAWCAPRQTWFHSGPQCPLTPAPERPKQEVIKIQVQESKGR